jgi:hypothetical protein
MQILTNYLCKDLVERIVLIMWVDLVNSTPCALRRAQNDVINSRVREGAIAS